MYHLLELFHSKNDEDLMDVELNMLQALLVVEPNSKIYAVLTVLFYKHGGENFAVKNSYHTFLCLSQPSPLSNWLTETRYTTKELGLFISLS